LIAAARGDACSAAARVAVSQAKTRMLHQLQPLASDNARKPDRATAGPDASRGLVGLSHVMTLATPALADGLLQGIQHQVRARRAAHAPADNAPGVGNDHERQVDSDAGSPACNRSWTQSSRSSPIARHTRPDARIPSGPPVAESPGNIASSLSWLHPLKNRSLRESRGGPPSQGRRECFKTGEQKVAVGTLSPIDSGSPHKCWRYTLVMLHSEP